MGGVWRVGGGWSKEGGVSVCASGHVPPRVGRPLVPLAMVLTMTYEGVLGGGRLACGGTVHPHAYALLARLRMQLRGSR